MSDEELAVDQMEPIDDADMSDEDRLMAKLKEAVTYEVEEIGSLRVKLTVTVPRETLDERKHEQFVELKRDALIPGFRKGHAPLELVEKRFGTDVGDQLTSQLVGSGYLAAVEKAELDTLGDPLIWVKVKETRTGEDHKPREVETEKLLPIDKALDHLKLPDDGPLTFACEVELKPKFDLPELKGIPVDRPSVSIDDDDVDTELKRLRMSHATYRPVTDGTIEADDLLYVDLKMTVDGEVIAEEENVDMAARDMRMQGMQLSGFGEAVVGKGIDDTVTLQATVPDDHENIDARGKTATFEIKINEIKRMEWPPIDEAFLTSIGFDSEAELREAIRSSLEARLDATIKRSMQEQVGAYLLDHTTLEIPEGLSHRQTERSIARRMIEMYQAGMPQAEIEKKLDEMRASAHHQVVRDMKLYFILDKIAEEFDVSVDEERINSAIAHIAQRSNKRFDRVRDELSKGDGLSTLYMQIRDEQIMDALLADAKITEREGPKKKAPKSTAEKKKVKKAAEPAAKREPKAAKASAKPAAKTAGKTAAKATKKKTAKKTAKKKTKKKST